MFGFKNVRHYRKGVLVENRKILLVDDEVNVLEGYKRQLRHEFDIHIAVGGEQALLTNGVEGPFAVIISDYRMPIMNGVEFLAKVRERSPDTVRMMLSGNADMDTAIEAVNEGSIFRFMTKPCPPEKLKKVIEDGITQYRLIIAERELLKNTLTGSIQVLVEILSMVNPIAFSRASRIRKYVRHIAVKLHFSNLWQYEIAALLSQIGCVTLPVDILNKYYSNNLLTADEEAMFQDHPKTGQKLLTKIPRMEQIAQIIEKQTVPYRKIMNDVEKMDTVAWGAQILKTALDFDRLIYGGMLKKSAIAELRNRHQEYHPEILDALDSILMDYKGQNLKTISVKDLQFGMIAEEDIRAMNGLLLVANGQEITYPIIVRLRNIAGRIGVKEPFRISLPVQQVFKGTIDPVK